MEKAGTESLGGVPRREPRGRRGLGVALGGSWGEGAEAIWLHEAEIPGEHPWPMGGREQGAWKTTLVAVWRTKRERFPAQPYSLGTRTRVHGQASRSRCGIEDRQDGICHLPNGYYVLLFKPIISSSPYIQQSSKNLYFPYFINEKNWQDWIRLICLIPNTTPQSEGFEGSCGCEAGASCLWLSFPVSTFGFVQCPSFPFYFTLQQMQTTVWILIAK